MPMSIEFYGVVLDQHGDPVPSAKVSGEVLGKWSKAPPVSTTTDAKGRFTIKSKGLALHLQVEKSGYYLVDNQGSLKPSSQGFTFFEGDGRPVHHPDPASPTIFHLRKAGNPVPLDRLQGQSKLPRDGTSVILSLSKTSQVTVKVGCLTKEDPAQPPNVAYDWHCELTVEGGGLQEATDKNSFLAPTEGYAPTAVIDMPKTLAPKQWNSRVDKTYWLRFPDHTFGKISFMMIARGDHFAVIHGHRNPSPDDANLEPKPDGR